MYVLVLFYNTRNDRASFVEKPSSKGLKVVFRCLIFSFLTNRKRLFENLEPRF